MLVQNLLLVLMCFGQKVQFQIDSNKVYNFVNILKLIDENKKFDSLECKLDPIFQSYDPTTITYFYDKNKYLRKIKYSLFEDGGKAYGYGIKYFDSTGHFIGTMGYNSKSNSFSCFFNRKYLINVNDETYKKKHFRKISFPKDSVINSTKINKVALLIEIYTQCIKSDIKYTKISIQKFSNPILEVFENIKVFSKPDLNSKVICNLNEGEKLYFLGSDKKKLIYNKLSWFWYLIKDEKGNTGWIFGHPSLVDIIRQQ